jgi:hypothetical protein
MGVWLAAQALLSGGDFAQAKGLGLGMGRPRPGMSWPKTRHTVSVLASTSKATSRKAGSVGRSAQGMSDNKWPKRWTTVPLRKWAMSKLRVSCCSNACCKRPAALALGSGRTASSLQGVKATALNR